MRMIVSVHFMGAGERTPGPTEFPCVVSVELLRLRREPLRKRHHTTIYNLWGLDLGHGNVSLNSTR